MALFGGKSSPQPSAAAGIAVDLAEEGLLRMRLSGNIDGPLVQQTIVRVRTLMGTRRARICLADMMAVTGIDTTMRAPGLDLFRVVKGYGITACIVATASPLVRLVASTLGMASGLRVEIVATSELAVQRVQKGLRSGSKE
jgi:hypothetical protein